MTAPPSGTLTFRYTDFAGSIERWEHHRGAMAPASCALTPEECRQYLHVEACPAGATGIH
jgi:hypothetical protein